MSDLPKSIEAFLEKNGLTKTLQAFQGEVRRTSNAPVRNAYSSLVAIKGARIPTDEENQNKIREHLQKADEKYLKKFV
jgi:esterase/lipase superfamily enzyme